MICKIILRDHLVLDGTGSVYSDTGWCLVVLGQYKLVLLNTWWYRVSMGLLCLCIHRKSGGVVGYYRCFTHMLTHSSSTKYSATQLVQSLKFKLSHAILVLVLVLLVPMVLSILIISTTKDDQSRPWVLLCTPPPPVCLPLLHTPIQPLLHYDFHKNICPSTIALRELHSYTL